MMIARISTHARVALHASAIGAAGVLSGPALAQEPLLELHSVGLYDWPENEKDAMAMAAVRLLRDRLADLGVEMDMDPGDAQVMGMAWDLLTARMGVRIAASENGLDASLVMAPEHGNAEGIHQQLSMLGMLAGMEFVDEGGGVSSAMGPLGAMDLGFDDDRVWLAMDGDEPVSLEVPPMGLPAGYTPVMSGRVDLNGLMELFAPEIAEMLAAEAGMLSGSGMGMVFGPDASPFEFGVGVDHERMLMVSRLIDARASMEAMGNSDNTLFTNRDLRAAPVDSVVFSAFPTNLNGMIETMRATMAISGGPDPMAEINAALGVDVIDDLLANIGAKGIYYQSMATGGGGLTSMVVVLEIEQMRRFRKAHETLIDRLNGLAEEQAEGYVRVRTWESGGVDAFTFTTPGLPVPFEPSWAVSKGRLVFALTPLALGEAIAQVHGDRDSSILDNLSFQQSAMSVVPPEGAVSMYYADSTRLAAKGFGMTNLLTSALANAARSPEHPGRVSGSLMPGYHDFVTGIAPAGGASYWDGDDVVYQYFGDRSMLVQTATTLGMLADVQGVAFPALMAGVMLPALEQARTSAQQVQSQAIARAMLSALRVYGEDSGGRPPASLDVLFDQGYLTEEFMMSPFGPAPDGGFDFGIRIDSDGMFRFDPEFVVIVDRAMLLNGHDEVSVGFADGHVLSLSPWELEMVLDLPTNQGAREQLQLDGF